MATIHSKMTYEEVSLETEKLYLSVLGGFQPSNSDGVSKKFKTLFLLRARAPEFWLAFQKSEEVQMGSNDPLDLWSMHIVNMLAGKLQPSAVFPFNGPLYAPCFTACPVRAFPSGTYDVASYKSDITGVYRKNCVSNGYAARRSCPLSQNFGRLTEQSSFHMRALVT